jgi:hypothetical protein
MPDSTPKNPILADDDARWLLVQTAASLSRLWARLDGIRTPGPMHVPVSQDITPPEPWLDVLPRDVALSGVVRAVLPAKALLIEEAVVKRPPDRRQICLVVQHIQCGAIEWSSNTLALARNLEVSLAENVTGEKNGRSIHQEIHRLDGTQGRSTIAWGGPASKERCGAMVTVQSAFVGDLGERR